LLNVLTYRGDQILRGGSNREIVSYSLDTFGGSDALLVLSGWY
jgi:hypothetical protein